MPTYPIFRCKECNCAIQMQSEGHAATFIAIGKKSEGAPTLFSSELDSDRFSDYCRGQGSFYAMKPANPFEYPKRFETHFNFSGAYEGMCCYCALMRGFHADSFISVGCYHCTRSDALITEFSRLKRRTGGGEGPTSWKSCGWGGLSDSVIDIILKMVVGGKTPK